MSALAFDPHAALAEIENRDGLRANRAKEANPGEALARLAPLALSPAPNTKAHWPEIAPNTPAAWAAALAMLDASRAPKGIAPDWWRTLLADALWITRNHAEAATALGWTASDLFGVRPQHGPGQGGLADRLDGARRLAFTTRIAHWQGDDGEGWLWRHTLDAKPLIWEV